MKLMATISIRLAAACAFAVCVASQGLAGESKLNLDGGRRALSGYDPVSYFADSGPQKGEESLVWERDGVAYWFSTPENLDRFRQSPDAYAPAFGGWCAWAMLEGDRVKVDPQSFRIHEGRLLLFYDGFWGNTLEKWKREATRVAEAELFARAETNWKEIVDK